MEPIHVWHCTQPSIARRGNHTVWTISLMSTQFIFYIVNAKKQKTHRVNESLLGRWIRYYKWPVVVVFSLQYLASIAGFFFAVTRITYALGYYTGGKPAVLPRLMQLFHRQTNIQTYSYLQKRDSETHTHTYSHWRTKKVSTLLFSHYKKYKVYLDRTKTYTLWKGAFLIFYNLWQT